MDVLDLMNDNNKVGMGHDMNARPFVCDFGECDKAFARKSDLARHYRIHTGDKPYSCVYPDCGKAFIQRSALTVHIRTHTGEKPHHCETCLKAFADSSSLARHRRIHTGNRPYNCYASECDRSFARRVTLLKHFVSAHPELPCPSTKTDRHPIHFAMNRNRGSAITGSDGEHYLATPVSISSPHAFAASRPPKSAAFSFSGGFSNQPTQPGCIEAGIGGGSARGRPRAINARPLQLASSPFQTPTIQSFGQSEVQPPNSAIIRALHTPLSTSSSFSHDGSFSQLGSPSTPFIGSLESSYDHPTTGGGQQGIGFNVGHQIHGHHTQHVYRKTSGNSLPPAPPGMMWYKSTDRSVSAPTPVRSEAPYVFAPFGNLAGFSANQLSIPPYHQSLLPSYYQAPPITMQQGEDAEMREGSPDLVDVRSVPTINVHQSASPMPHSAVLQFSNLDQGPSQSVMHTPAPGRLHSAPPFLNRFHSSPQVPTVSSWTMMEPSQGPGRYGDAYSLEGARSGEDEDWEQLEDQMISREASAGPNETHPSETQVSQQVSVAHQLPKEVNDSLWDAPIAFPQATDQRAFSSSASVASTSSTLVNPAQDQAQPQFLPTLAVFPQSQFVQPVSTPTHGQQTFYPSPITTWSTSMSNVKGFTQPMYPQYPVQSPIHLQPKYLEQQQYPLRHPNIPTYSDSQNVTLATPPRLERTVSGVGLGISNVHFGDSVVEDESDVDTKTPFISDDGIEEDDDYDAGEDDSDDSFVPSGRGKPRKKINGKKKGRSAFTMKPRKRQVSA